MKQTEATDIEIIVASNFNGGAKEIIEQRFPQVKYLALHVGATVPELRTAGLSCSSGEIVAFIEDHCVVDDRWSSEIRHAHESPNSIVGGSVENASRERLLDWAVYFYDYGKYMPPNEAGAIDSLSGINVSYKRMTLKKVGNSFRQSFFETFVHEQLKRQGEVLYLVPSAIVYHKKSYKLKEVLLDCYEYGRSFGGLRVHNVAVGKRLVLAFGSLALPVLLPLRIAREFFKREGIPESWCCIYLIFYC